MTDEKYPIESEKYTTSTIYIEHLDKDEDLERMLIEEAQNQLLFKTMFYTLLLLIINFLAW